MTSNTLRTLLRPAVELVTGGLQGKICLAAWQALRHFAWGLPETLTLPGPSGSRQGWSNYSSSGLRVLDIGHANIMEYCRKLLLWFPPSRHLTGIDIIEPIHNITPSYVLSLRGNVASSSLLDASCDLSWCISTMEHLGMDNSGYASVFTRGEHQAARAVRKMIRLLTPGGSLLITGPYGRYEHNGWHINYDVIRRKAVWDAAPPHAGIREWYFHHAPAGWTRVVPEALASMKYHDQMNAGATGLAAALITRTAESADR